MIPGENDSWNILSIHAGGAGLRRDSPSSVQIFEDERSAIRSMEKIAQRRLAPQKRGPREKIVLDRSQGELTFEP